jgi:aminoglycoside phosphotransferase (APT) family kinase protein
VVDPQVAGAAVLTDIDALTELLSATDETLLQRPYLRWKPGTSCVSALQLASGPAYAAAFSAAAGRKLVKTLEQAPAGSVLLADHGLGVLVARPSADRDLPALRHLGSALARVQRHHPRSATGRAPGDLVSAVEGVRTLAYKPFRRWVGAVLGDQTGYVLRAYRRGDLEQARTGVKTARRLLGGLTPQPVGQSRGQGLLVQAWVSGESLDCALAAGSAPADALSTIGRTLAGVHRHQPPPSARRLVNTPLGAAAELLGALDVDLGRWAAHLAARLDGCRRQDEHSVFVHGDFSVDQVVLGPGGPVFLDWDRAGIGPAAVDLASMRAAGLDLRSWQRVLDGYREVRPLPRDLDWYLAAALLERAPEPFRRGHREWRSEIGQQLAAVGHLLG